MKKLFSLLFLTLFLIGCEEPYTSELTTKQVYTFQVKSSDWVKKTDKAGLNKYYSASFRIKGLDSYIYNNGTVMAYVMFGDYQQILPYTRHYESEAGQQWTRTIDFDFSEKNIVFYVTSSDFVDEQPEEMVFRVVLMW